MGHQPERFLKLPTVIDRTGVGRAMIYRRMDDGTFPLSVKIGDRAIAWRESEIDRWISERISASRTAS